MTDKMPRDLAQVYVKASYAGRYTFMPTGFSCTLEEYERAYQYIALWNPLEVGGQKMTGLVERYLRTGDTHEEPEDPFETGGEDGFIDEW